ncbi:hypothetical protein OIE68_09305 [Nocardia vinacea]|uniref:sigma factor-like helix-turn-helix DNA-binding protein n=1 Tax=Nocardia vinacea TaxID=96468 RepID=UPI002E13AC60|nr:hypothetical protein OIE68_09305 [Nocardia vinacea]
MDEFPNKEVDEYTKPPGTTYKIPGQPDPPDGPPPNAIPIVLHPTTPALPDTGPAIPLTDRPQVPIPDTAVPGAPAENDQDEQKPRVHDSEPPLPRHNNTPAPHLPATPADRPTELNPPSHYATTPNPQTPGAPTDPTATPQNHDSTQYIPDPTVQPTRGGTPATTLAGPLPQPVVPARPVPMASASANDPKKRKRKQETPPESPAPVPTTPPQPKPKKRPGKGQPPPQPAAEPPPTPTSGPPTPAAAPKPRKRSSSSTPPIRELFIVRQDGEDTGVVGEEGPRVRPAGRARAWVRSLPQKFPWLTEDLVDTAELLVSETVANSLRWTKHEVAVILTVTDTDDVRQVRFTVTDKSSVVPESTDMPDWDAECGRGGPLVDMLSADHGTIVQDNGTGKSTWFELHQPHGGPSDLGIPSAAPDNDDSGSDAASPPSPPEPTPTPFETNSAATEDLPAPDRGLSTPPPASNTANPIVPEHEPDGSPTSSRKPGPRPTLPAATPFGERHAEQAVKRRRRRRDNNPGTALPVEKTAEIVDALANADWLLAPIRKAVRDNQNAMADSIGTLPETQRATLYYRFVQGLSAEATAETLGRTIGATKALQSRALQTISEVLPGDQAALLRPPMGRRRAATSVPPTPAQPNPELIAPEPADPVTAIDNEIRDLEHALGIETDAERMLEIALYQEGIFWRTAIAAEQVRPELLFGQTEWLSWLDARKYAQKHLDDELTVDFILELHRRLGSRIQPDDTGKFHIAKNKHWGVLSRPLTESERGDFHGRLTRVLLYWALEKAGVPPSAIPDFDEDLYGSAADWTETIRAGSMQYRLLKGGLAQLGRTVPPVILANLEYARDRYRQMNGRRSPFVPGELHDGVACKRLLAILEGAGPLPDDSELVHAIIDKPLRAEDATPSRDAPLKHHPITNGDPPPSVIGNRVATDGADISKASPRNPSEQSATPWGGRGSSDTPVASPGAPRARGAMPFDPVLMAGNNGTDVEIDHAVARRRNGRNDGAWAVFNRFGVDNAGQHDGRKRRDKGVAAEAAPTPWNHRRSAEKNKTPMKSDFQRTPGTDKVAAPDSALEPENHTTPDTNNSNTQQGSPRPAAESIPEPDAIGSNTHAHSPKPTTESSAQGNSPHTAHKSDSRTQAGPALAPGSPIGAARAPQSGNPKQSKTVQQAKESPAAAAPGSPEPGVPGAPGHGALSPEQSQQGPGAAPQPDPYKWDPGRDWVATEHVSVLGVVHAFEQLNPATKVSFQPGVDLRRAQEALQTIHDHLTKHPMVVIRELALTSFEDGRIYDGFPHVSDGQVVTGRLQLDVDYVIREKEKEDRSLTIEEVWQCATEMFADALMFATCWRAEAQAETALRKTHERRAATESPVDFDKWLQTQFTKACFFNKKSLRDLDIRQAFRQSFAAKEYWFNPSPGEYALYSLLTTLARQLHGMTLPPERVLTAAELASMEEGAEIARGLEHDLGVKAVGLAGPDLDLDALRQFAQAMRELLTKNPGLLAPDPEHHRPVIGVDMPSRYTTMIWTRSQEIDGRRQVTGFWLSERYAMSLSLFQQDVQRSVDSQWLSADSEQAFKSIAFHEEGHWFHNLSGLKYIPEADYQNIMSALVALFVRTSLSTTMDTFPAWLRRELSGYSFQRRETKHKASETPKEQEGADAVALRELYAEANMAVNMHGSRATDAQKLVHSHLMAAYERQKQSEHDAGGVRSEGGEDGLTAAPHKPSERSVTPWSGAGSVNAENRPADRHSATDGDVRATQQAGRDAGGTASAPTDGQSKPGRAGDTPVASPAAPRGRGAMPFDPVQMAGDNGRDVEIDHAVARRRNGRNAGAWAVFNRFAGENAGQHDGRKRPDKGAAAEAAPTPWSRRSADTAAVPARPQTVQVLSQTPDDLEMQIRWQRALRDDAATERGLDPAMLTPNSLALEWLRIRAEAARDELAESLGVDRGELYPRLVRHALDELQAGLNYLHDEGWLRVSRERPATEVMAWIGRFVRQIAAEQEATTQQQKNHLKLIRDELHSNLHEILGTRWELGRASIFAIDWKFDIGKVNDKRELLLGQSWRPFENNPMGNLRRYGHVAGIPEILHLADAVECFEAATLVQHADEFNRLSAMAEAGTGMSRTVARFDSSTRQEFVAPVPMRDEFLRNFPRIPVEQAFSSIADIGRSFSLDPYGLRLTAQAYDVASEFIAPFHKWVGESMLHRLRPRAAENPLWRCMFAARDGHIIAAAIRNIDPVFFAKFCREVGYSSKVIEMVARDFERLTGKKLPLPKTFRSGLSEEAEALVSGTYRNFVKHMRSEGIDLELPGSAYTIVDDALRGRMEEVVKHVFTEPEITGEYTILTIHPDDPHPNSKRGHLFHLPASHWQGGSGLTRYVPAEERLTFLANPAVWIFEELGQGPAHTVETITENGPDQRRAPKTRFSRDRFPPDLDEMAREPRVVQAMKTAVLLATAHYARDGGQGDVRPFLRQSRSWVLQDGNTDPRFFALASALVPRFQGVQEGWLVPDARPTRPKLPTGGNAGETFAPTRTRKAAP